MHSLGWRDFFYFNHFFIFFMEKCSNLRERRILELFSLKFEVFSQRLWSKWWEQYLRKFQNVSNKIIKIYLMQMNSTKRSSNETLSLNSQRPSFTTGRNSKPQGIQLSISKSKDKKNTPSKKTIRLSLSKQTRLNSKTNIKASNKLLISCSKICGENLQTHENQQRHQLNFDQQQSSHHAALQPPFHLNNELRNMKYAPITTKSDNKLEKVPTTPINKILFLDQEQDQFVGNNSLKLPISGNQSTQISSNNSAQFFTFNSKLF